jgi:ketosteroid isomerase-like protein
VTIREIINAYYQAVNAGDWQAWLALFSEDVSGDEQLAGHFEGIETLRGAVTAITRGYAEFHMIPQRVVVDGDDACVLWRCEAVSARGEPIAYERGDGPPRPVIGANYFRIEGGRIVYMRTIHDSRPFGPFVALMNEAP